MTSQIPNEPEFDSDASVPAEVLCCACEERTLSSGAVPKTVLALRNASRNALRTHPIW